MKRITSSRKCGSASSPMSATSPLPPASGPCSCRRYRKDMLLVPVVVVEQRRDAAGPGQFGHGCVVKAFCANSFAAASRIVERCSSWVGALVRAISVLPVRMKKPTRPGNRLRQRSSKLITTRSVSGCAWQVSTKPSSTSGCSSEKFLSMRTLPSSTRATASAAYPTLAGERQVQPRRQRHLEDRRIFGTKVHLAPGAHRR